MPESVIPKRPTRPGDIGPGRRRASLLGLAVQGAWLLATAAGGYVLVRSGYTSPTTTDFATFYASSFAWRSGTPVPATEVLNLNPPTLHLLLAPLTYLDLATAHVLWWLISAVCMWLAIREVRKVVRWPRLDWLLVCLVAMMPAFWAWIFGQLTWVLLYPVTKAWRATSSWKAGLWLAPAIAVKPPLALIAVALPWRVTTTAAIGSVVLSAATFLVTGPDPWKEWLAHRDEVTWLRASYNLSLVGMIARLAPGTPPSELPLVGIGAVVVVAGAMWLWIRSVKGDRRWLFACWWSLLVSPAGWAYYLPLCLGPLLATWRWTIATRLAVAIFALPLALRLTLLRLPSFGLIDPWLYPAAFVMLWWAWRRKDPTTAAV